MGKLLILSVMIMLGFSQISWEKEIVDSITASSVMDFTSNSLALDNHGLPHIVYNKDEYEKIIYASRSDTCWQKELVESGLFYACFSLIFDEDNNAHLSYYRKDDALNMTYLCYARRDTTGWIIDVVDSIYGIITNYWFTWNYLKTSIALDTADLPGIAYTSWNLSDSLFYIKYAHYSGVDWDTSLVEYDSVWAPHLGPSDWYPGLRFNSENIPVIAFHQKYSSYCDTIKIALFDDSLNEWVIEPAICDPMGGKPVSLALNSQDYPCIAHGWGAAVAYSWQDGIAWHTELTGTTMGWVNIRIVLDLDNLDNPHIMYLPDPIIAYASYSYKYQGFWYNCGPIDPDPYLYNLADISFALDNNDEPHVCYQFDISGSNLWGIKYAKGTFVGVEEETRSKKLEARLIVYPNPFSKLTIINFGKVRGAKGIELKIYDAAGRVVKYFSLPRAYCLVPTSISWDGTDNFGNQVSGGVYFVRLSCDDFAIIRKVTLLR